MSALLFALFDDGSFGRDGASSVDREAIARREADARTIEQALVARIRAGDEMAFREMVDEYFPRLSRFAYGILDERDMADDIVQDVLARVWEQHEELDVEHSLKAYLFGAVRNRALNARKHWRVRARTATSLSETIVHTAEQAPNVLERLESEVLLEALARAVAELPERRRTAIRLRYEESLTYPSIAAILGISVKSAEQLVALTIQSLRKSMRRVR